MSTLRQPKTIPTQVFDSLTHNHRRRLLVILRECEEPATERELADRLAATKAGGSVENDSVERIRRLLGRLRHVHLPKLDEAGLVRWNGTAETVSLTDHPVHDDAQLQRFVQTEADGWDDVISSLADGRRRAVLAALESRRGHVARDALARDVATREGGGEPSTGTADEVEGQLHHIHLPKLEQAGLVEYDVDDESVVYRGHPKLPRMESLNPSDSWSE